MNSPSSPAASATAARPPRTNIDSLRFLAAIGLGILFALILTLAILPVGFAPSATNWVVLGLVVLTPSALLWLARRRRIGGWWTVAGGYLVVAPVLVYLASDDATLRHNVTLEDIAPAFPGAEKSYDVLMRYGKNHPLGRDFKAPQRILLSKSPSYASDITKAEDWRTWALAHRADIEADWAELAPVRAWWDELATFDRIGDLTESRFDAEIMGFAAPRSYTQHAIAIAGLQALDGHGDEAFATLQPLLEVSRKLEPSARTLLRFMIARIIQKMAIETAGFVLDHTNVSAAARARFAAALAGGSGGEAGARRLIGIEYAFGSGILIKMRAGDIEAGQGADKQEPGLLARPYLHVALNAVSPVIFNPVRTMNLEGDLSEQLQDLAARRQAAVMGPVGDTFFRTTAQPRMKNLFGSKLIEMSVPAFSKVTESYWKIEDERTALRARLEKP
jgi:hypothetical protein